MEREGEKIGRQGIQGWLASINMLIPNHLTRGGNNNNNQKTVEKIMKT